MSVKSQSADQRNLKAENSSMTKPNFLAKLLRYSTTGLTLAGLRPINYFAQEKRGRRFKSWLILNLTLD